MHPEPTARLAFREMTPDDLDDMAAMLGDPDVMHFYPRPKTREEAQGWIDWTLRNYAEQGYGLWVIETREGGEFVGDCGLTWQEIDGQRLLEVGFHVARTHQRNGYASEAAQACVDHAFERLGADEVTAIINPDNVPSRRVAERLGMSVKVRTTDRDGLPVVVYSVERP
ncbi:GNAT family N-acetyltransferase [Actinomycetota bacterium]